MRELTVPSPSISGTGAVRGYSLASEPGGAKGDIQHSAHGGLVRQGGGRGQRGVTSGFSSPQRERARERESHGNVGSGLRSSIHSSALSLSATSNTEGSRSTGSQVRDSVPYSVLLHRMYVRICQSPAGRGLRQVSPRGVVCGMSRTGILSLSGSGERALSHPASQRCSNGSRCREPRWSTSLFPVPVPEIPGLAAGSDQGGSGSTGPSVDLDPPKAGEGERGAWNLCLKRTGTPPGTGPGMSSRLLGTRR